MRGHRLRAGGGGVPVPLTEKPAGGRRRARTLVGAGLRAAEAAQQRAFERRLGVATRGNVYPGAGVAETGRVFYEPCQWLPVRRALRQLRPTPNDVLVDLGAGKGQGLLIAGRLPFGGLIGVELDDDLAAQAGANLERARSRLKTGAELVRGDATAWRIPDDASVVFMYCPFIGDAFHRALDGVFASHDRRPRRLHIVYVFPFEHNWLISTGRVKVKSALPARWPTRPRWWRTSWVIVTYRVTSRDDAGPPSDPTPPAALSVAGAERARGYWSEIVDHEFWVGEPGAPKAYSPSAPAGRTHRL